MIPDDSHPLFFFFFLNWSIVALQHYVHSLYNLECGKKYDAVSLFYMARVKEFHRCSPHSVSVGFG